MNRETALTQGHLSSQPCGQDNNHQTPLKVSGPCTDHMFLEQVWFSVAPRFSIQVTMTSSLATYLSLPLL